MRREVLEETGIRVEPEHLTGVYKHMRLGVIALVFRCHAVGGVETTGGESIAVDWLTPEQITERMQMPRRAGGRRQQEDRRRPLGDSDDIRDDGES